jgi:hypothetical protein
LLTRLCGKRALPALKHPLRPVNGVIPLPAAPGANMALHADKIETEGEIRA